MHALVDRVLPKARTDVAHFGDLERHRQRAGAKHEREVLRGLQRAAAQRDLAVAPDGAVDAPAPSRRVSSSTMAMLSLTCLPVSLLKRRRTFVVQRELHDVAFDRIGRSDVASVRYSPVMIGRASSM